MFTLIFLLLIELLATQGI